MEKLISNIYALSDNAVLYSADVRGEFTDVLSEKFMEDHEFLDSIYHFLQNELSNEDLSAISWRTLFSDADIKEWTAIDDEEMVQDMMDWYIQVIWELDIYIEWSDCWIKSILGEKYQEMKNKITFYRNFLTKEPNESAD